MLAGWVLFFRRASCAQSLHVVCIEYVDTENTSFNTQIRDYVPPSVLKLLIWFFCSLVFHICLWVNIFMHKMCNFGYIRINIATSPFPTLNPPGQLEPWRLPTDLCLRGQDRETLGCWCRYGRHHLQHGHWSGRPAAGLPVAERPPPQHLLVRIHQLSGQEQPWPAHTHHQGQTLKRLRKLFLDIANTVLETDKTTSFLSGEILQRNGCF